MQEEMYFKALNFVQSRKYKDAVEVLKGGILTKTQVGTFLHNISYEAARILNDNYNCFHEDTISRKWPIKSYKGERIDLEELTNLITKDEIDHFLTVGQNKISDLGADLRYFQDNIEWLTEYLEDLLEEKNYDESLIMKLYSPKDIVKAILNEESELLLINDELADKVISRYEVKSEKDVLDLVEFFEVYGKEIRVPSLRKYVESNKVSVKTFGKVLNATSNNVSKYIKFPKAYKNKTVLDDLVFNKNYSPVFFNDLSEFAGEEHWDHHIKNLPATITTIKINGEYHKSFEDEWVVKVLKNEIEEAKDMSEFGKRLVVHRFLSVLSEGLWRDGIKEEIASSIKDNIGIDVSSMDYETMMKFNVHGIRDSVTLAAIKEKENERIRDEVRENKGLIKYGSLAALIDVGYRTIEELSYATSNIDDFLRENNLYRFNSDGLRDEMNIENIKDIVRFDGNVNVYYPLVDFINNKLEKDKAVEFADVSDDLDRHMENQKYN
ncbi:MAG: hypothetical protein N4A47_03725 [Clostridia bacterium]|jgi:hypothetical protein|nr:hypothetical protein [Clostridia bacterium]